MNGRPVAKVEGCLNSHQIIPVGHLKSGMYILQAISENYCLKQKIIIY
jgi:hypothetical protein